MVVRGGRFRASIDHSGHRVATDRPRAPAASSAIVLLGDSFVFGLNVDDRDTFAWQLARRMPDRRIVNLGVPGYGTDQQLISLEDYFQSERGQPTSDIVVVVFENDFADVQRSFDRFLGRRKPVFQLADSGLDRGGFRLSTLDRVMDYSRLVWLVRSQAANLRDAPSIPADSGKDVVVASLNAIRRLGEAHGARVHIFAHRRVTRASTINDPVWQHFLRETGADDITETFRPAAAGNPIGFDGAHWNTEGHRRAALVIGQSLIRPRG